MTPLAGLLKALMLLEAYQMALIYKFMTLAAPAKHSGMKNGLAVRGFVILGNLSEGDALGIVNGLGDVLLQTDVYPQANVRGDVSTDLPMDFHTDHPGARWIAWHCIRQSSEGGESLLIDSLPLISRLTKDERDSLRNTWVRTHVVFPTDTPTHPVLTPDKYIADRIYFTPWLISEESKQPLLRLGELIAKEEPVNIRLKPGDLLVIDNSRMLHGRTAIGGDRERLLRRYWISQVATPGASISFSSQQ
jgi:hypothetical protein